MKRFDTTVLSVAPIARDYFELRFAVPPGAIAGTPAPGTFLTVKAGGGSEPLLRRPFAFSDFTAGDGPAPGSVNAAGSAAFIFQRRGRGTAWLAALAPGAPLDVLGPLGTGFPAPQRGSAPVLVAGGIGLGPILYLARRLTTNAYAGLCEAPFTALGFRSAAFVPSVDLPEATVVCTDDGGTGFHGTVADWLRQFDPGKPPTYYACGPAPMMAAVAAVAASRNAPYWAATEQWMACGVGACMGCAVRLKDGGYARACADGPVFDGRALAWD